METTPTPWAARVNEDITQSSGPYRGGRSSKAGPSRYRAAVASLDAPPVAPPERRQSPNPFGDTFKRSDSVGSQRSALNLHNDIAPRSGVLPFQLEAHENRGVAAPWWQRSIEVPLSTSNIALVVGSFGCLLGVIALGVAVRADTRDPIKEDLRKTNGTLAVAVTQYVVAALNATRNRAA